jgi:HlyD family secretion protein
MANKSKRTWLIVGLVLVLATLIGLAVAKGKRSPKGERVKIEEVKKRTIKETVSGSGKVFPEREVKISSDVSGEIVELYIAEGDSVKAGQVLAKIDPDAYESAVERGQAALSNAKANAAMSRSQVQNANAQKEQIFASLENAKNVHSRNTNLYNEGVISELEFDQSLANLRGLEANLRAAEASLESAKESVKGSEFNVESAQASLKELRTNLNRTTISSPVAGIVSSLSVEQGERVVGTIQMTGTEMMRIANLNEMEVQVEVSENDILKVKLNDKADIEVDAYLDKTFNGVVTEIANSAANIQTSGSALSSDQVTNFIVKIRIDADSYQDLVSESVYPFRPGMSASVDIYTSQVENVITIPIQAITTRLEDEDDDNSEDLEVVFVYDADTVSQVNIKSGIQDDEYIHVLSGLEEGLNVVISPYSAISKKLEDGARVVIKEDKEKDED